MKNNIEMSSPLLGSKELESIKEVFETGYLGQGAFVEKFENELINLFCRTTTCVSTGTAALHLALESIGLNEKDEVLVQSLTYAATYQAIVATGAIPISCDVYEHDLSFNINDAKKKITSKTKAILPMFYSGYPGNLDELYNFAKENHLRVIEDAAHAFGSKYKDNFIGSIGDITCFSFDPVKTITCGEGGAIITEDPLIIARLKESRYIGITKIFDQNFFDGKYRFDMVNSLGWRYHMSNINAAIGLTQLQQFNELKLRRQSLAKSYSKLLATNKYIDLLPYNYDDIVPYIYVIKLKKHLNFEIINKLKDYNIIAGFHYFPCHLQPYFNSLYKTCLPVTENIYTKLLTLPLHPRITNEDIIYISEVLETILE